MDEQSLFTPFDEMVQSKELQMLKTMLPYIPSNKQKQMVFVINYLQLKNAISVISNPPASLCAAEVGTGNENYTAMLSALKKYCSTQEKDTIDNIINLLCIINNYDSLLT